MSLPVAVALLALAVAAPAAGADVAFGPCPADGIPSAGGRCATVEVPLDRSGAVPGTLGVGIQRLTAHGRSRGTVLVLAGGPGDAASATFARARQALEVLRTEHDVVLIDQRGTGRSGPIDCPGDTASCAAKLGPAAHLYGTPDLAGDVDAVREALGLETVTIYGVSYGTYAAIEYARRYPSRVASLVLDSVLDRRMADDPFTLDSFAALPGVLRAECAGGRCRGITKDPYKDFRAVAARLPAASADKLSLVQVGLAILASDVDSDLRAELPAAFAAARRGDIALLRRAGEAAGLSAPYDPRFFSPGLRDAAACDDYEQAWDRSTPPEDRVTVAQQRFAAVPAATFAPFPPGLAFLSLDVTFCAGWPQLPTSHAATGPLPDVPALLLSGGADLRTPTAGARRLAKELPHATLLIVKATGHAVAFDEPCGRRAVAAFLTGGTLPRCDPAKAAYPPLPLVPKAWHGTLAAAAELTWRYTATDAAARADAQRGRVATDRFEGLHGGTVTRHGDAVRLANVVVVPGIRVSGTKGHLRARRV